MAKSVALISALCILALAAVAHSHKEVFDVVGEVYCDVCRFQFHNDLSYKLEGATVKLECSNIDTKAVTYTTEGVTDASGRYRLQVTGDHELDICQVNVVKSPKEDCNEVMHDVVDSKIEITENSGMHTDVRFANPIGFMAKEAKPECAALLDKYFKIDDEE
ncbi:hypothetical protein BUALT_Bualt03G0145800 [Buddleja alternifolia]|uniref:Uncharacterized protein n=1 Tax=Buddleja alternifolia TaxID=168488 RepID=A0AAV6XUX2_9LAMI|nr:hypothetical protein BUALT_Bualt03G0145800 [Buddleja alternifolia]